jgi:hypothetical protein
MSAQRAIASASSACRTSSAAISRMTRRIDESLAASACHRATAAPKSSRVQPSTAPVVETRPRKCFRDRERDSAAPSHRGTPRRLAERSTRQSGSP